MTLLAIAVGNAILAWLTIVVALVGAVVAVALLTRVVQPAREIGRYASEIEGAGRAISANLEGASELERSRELVRSLRGAEGG